ncbi:MAG: HAD family phosphatase [Lachnospiraceae bacterium]|nr:HAD family phosphatase [Lachnospiraceae bacterium]
MTGRIKTVIFDIGGVLAPFDWREYMTELFHDKKIVEEVYGTVFGHDLWDELDRGVWSNDKLLSEFTAINPGLEKEIRLFFETCACALHKADYAAEWITELKARGYRVLYLSNYSRHVLDTNPDITYFVPLTDGGIFSCFVHLVKPEREIYECIRDRYGLNPAETVFIDDVEANVEGARAVGFNGIRFLNLEQAKAELNNLLEGS